MNFLIVIDMQVDLDKKNVIDMQHFSYNIKEENYMKKWEKFSESELKEIILNSQTYKEALQKIGYNGSSNYNHYIKEISQKYNIDISHFPTGQVIDLTGQKFGKLTVIQRANNIGQQPAWLCQCECGNIKSIRADALKRKN